MYQRIHLLINKINLGMDCLWLDWMMVKDLFSRVKPLGGIQLLAMIIKGEGGKLKG